MPRPTTKTELLTAAYAQLAKRWILLDSMPEAMQQGTFPFEDRDCNVRDVLTHLHDAKKMLRESHDSILSLIQPHRNGKLFDRSIYKWTKPSTIGAYFISCTSSQLRCFRADFAALMSLA